MRDDAERLEMVDKIMEQKEIIKKASQEIIEKVDDPLANHYIDTKVIEIMNAVSNMGIIVNEPERFSKFIDTWGRAMELISTHPRIRAQIARYLLNMVCAISFPVNKKCGKYKINIPKIDISILKIGILLPK